MKKLLAFLLALTMALTCCSCGEEEQADNNGSGNGHSHGETGIRDQLSTSERKTVTLTEISSSVRVSDASENLYGPYYTAGQGALYIPFYYGSQYQYTDQTGNTVLGDPDPTGSGAFYNFSEGYAFAHGSVIDRAGNICYTLPDFFKSFVHDRGLCSSQRIGSYFKDGYAVMVKKNDERNNYGYYVCRLTSTMQYSENQIKLPEGFGFYDKSWQPINEGGFHGAVGVCGNRDQEQKIVIVDHTGSVVAAFDAKKAHMAAEDAFSIVCFCKGMTRVQGINAADSDLLKMLCIQNGYAAVMNDSGRWGLMNLKTGSMAIDYAYDYVGACADGVVPVCKLGLWGLVDTNGNSILPCENFRYIGAFTNGRAIAVDTNEKVCVIDKNGNIVRTLDISFYKSLLNGRKQTFFHTPFTETTHIAVLYQDEKAYVISDEGDILLSITPEDGYSSNVEHFLHMNDEYMVVFEEDNAKVYKITCQ